jgi:bifunctional DNA-binding transcriptional regulator/antitoxin component of YhaV-PrlF toxin-antitoxin module
VDNVVGINSRGSLVIPKKLVDALGLDKTTLFRVLKDGIDLNLKAKKRPPKTILRKKKFR